MTGTDYSKFTEIDWKQRIEEVDNNNADWDSNFKYLLPGVMANDYNTIIKEGYLLKFIKNISLKEKEIVLNKLKEHANKGDKESIYLLGYFYLHRANNIDDIKTAKKYFEILIDGKNVYKSKQASVYETAYLNLFLIYNKHLGQYEKYFFAVFISSILFAR